MTYIDPIPYPTRSLALQARDALLKGGMRGEVVVEQKGDVWEVKGWREERFGT